MPIRKKPMLAGLDAKLIVRDALNTLDMPSRRRFGKRALSLGALSMMTGCSITDDASVERMLTAMSRFNDRVQGWLFDPKKLAQTYPDSMITTPFPFNAFYEEDEVPEIDDDYVLRVGGLVADRGDWTLDALRALPQDSQVTRHICVEGWSAIGKWGGVPFADFLRRIGADTSAPFVGFRCADDYYTSIDMATALHPQTLLTLTFADRPLPPKYGYPMKLRIPTKLGYKNPKHITEIFVARNNPGGYWEDQGYNWFGGA
ncbi:MAG: molybdopterin-dependent oxidoreductase [Burkholderiaceae bacterium]